MTPASLTLVAAFWLLLQCARIALGEPRRYRGKRRAGRATRPPLVIGSHLAPLGGDDVS